MSENIFSRRFLERFLPFNRFCCRIMPVESFTAGCSSWRQNLEPAAAGSGLQSAENPGKISEKT